jgi:outer membrane protein
MAVAYLYYMHYSYISSDKHKITEANAAAANSFKIAYFELDTLENSYEFYKEVRTFLTTKQDQMNAQLNKLRDNYMNKVNEFKNRGPNLSQTEQSEFTQQLAKMENDYRDQEQGLGQDMQATTMQKLQEVKNKIEEFLKNYCRSKGYAYVFASSENDYLYYKDTIRNITSDVVRLLNEQHNSEKKK